MGDGQPSGAVALARVASGGSFAERSAAEQPRSPPPRKTKTAPKVVSAAAAPPGDRLAPLVLTAKNIQALRTLFNVAHRLAETLDARAWALVLGALLALERALASPATTTAESASLGSGTAAKRGVRGVGREDGSDGDLAVLAAAAEQLFASSVRLEDDALAALAEGLRRVGVEELEAATNANASTREGAPLGALGVGEGATTAAREGSSSPLRLIALERLVDVSLMNARRAGTLLWPAFEAHVVGAAAAETDPEVLSAVFEQLERFIVETLGREEEEDEDEADVPEEAREALESAVLAPLPRLARGAASRDARIRAVRVARAVTRERGERVKSAGGWDALLETLERPAKDASGARVGPSAEEEEVEDGSRAGKTKKKSTKKPIAPGSAPRSSDVQLGWSALAAVASDLLPAGAVPSSRRARLVAAIFAYVEQTDDLNAALSAVGALWTVADQLAAVAEAEEPVGNAGKIFVSATLARHLTPAFVALRDASLDARSEIRDGAVKALAAALGSRGDALSDAAFRSAAFDLYFPLLREIRATAFAASDEELQTATVGTSTAHGADGGERKTEVKMLVHHSRNTESKRWNETLVAALGGFARFARASFARLERLDGFASVWEGFLSDVIADADPTIADRAGFAGSRRMSGEAHRAAFAATQSALASKEASPSGSRGAGPLGAGPLGAGPLRRRTLKSTLDAYERCAREMNRAGNLSDAKTRKELIVTLEKVREAKRDAFDEDDVRTVLHVVDLIARAPEAWERETPGTLSETSGRAALEDGHPEDGPTPRLRWKPSLGSSYAASSTQKACADAIARLPPLDAASVDAGLYPQALCQLLSYVAEATGREPRADGGGGDRLDGGDAFDPEESSMETQPRSMNAELAAHACNGFGALYGSDRIPGDDKAAVFGVATRVTSSAMSGEYPGDAADVEALRRAASGAFVATMAHGVPATHRYASATRSLPEDWAAVADAFDAFVDFAAKSRALGGGGPEPSEPSDATLRRERDVLECVTRVVAPQSASAPERVRERIVAALERGAATFPADPGPGSAADAGSEDSELGPSDDAGRYFAGVISEGAAKEAAGGSGKEAVGSLKERPHSFAYRCAGGLARLYGRSRRENAPAGAAAIGRLALFAATRFASATLGAAAAEDAVPARYRGEVDAREASRLNARVALAEETAIAIARVACRLEGGEFDGAAAGERSPARGGGGGGGGGGSIVGWLRRTVAGEDERERECLATLRRALARRANASPRARDAVMALDGELGEDDGAT